MFIFVELIGQVVEYDGVSFLGEILFGGSVLEKFCFLFGDY